MNQWKIGDKVIADGKPATVIDIDPDSKALLLHVRCVETGRTYWPHISRVAPSLPTDLGELEALAARVAEAIEKAKRPAFKVGDRVRLEATVTSVSGEAACIKADKHTGDVWYHKSVLTKVQQ